MSTSYVGDDSGDGLSPERTFQSYESDLVRETSALLVRDSTVPDSIPDDVSALDTMHQMLQKVMLRRRQLLLNHERELPTDEIEREAWTARSDYLSKSITSDVELQVWKDVLQKQVAVQQKLKQLKNPPHVESAPRDRDPQQCLHALDACLMISLPQYRKFVLNPQLKRDMTEAHSEALKQEFVTVCFARYANEVTVKFTRRNLGMKFSSNWGGLGASAQPQVTFIRPKGHGHRLGIEVGDKLVKVKGQSLDSYSAQSCLETLKEALMGLPAARPFQHAMVTLAITFSTFEGLLTKTFTRSPLGFEVGRAGWCGPCSKGAKVVNVNFDGEAIEFGVELDWKIHAIGDDIVARWNSDRILVKLHEAEETLDSMTMAATTTKPVKNNLWSPRKS